MKEDLLKMEAWADTGCIGEPEEPKHWKYHLIFADDPTIPISTTTHHGDVQSGRDACDLIGYKAVTHNARSSMAANLAESG